MWKFIPWSSIVRFVERIGVPSALAGGLLYLIFGGMARLEKKIDDLVLQDSVNSVVLKGYRDSSEERVRLLRKRFSEGNNGR